MSKGERLEIQVHSEEEWGEVVRVVSTPVQIWVFRRLLTFA